MRLRVRLQHAELRALSRLGRLGRTGLMATCVDHFLQQGIRKGILNVTCPSSDAGVHPQCSAELAADICRRLIGRRFSQRMHDNVSFTHAHQDGNVEEHGSPGDNGILTPPLRRYNQELSTGFRNNSVADVNYAFTKVNLSAVLNKIDTCFDPAFSLNLPDKIN